MLRKFSHQGHSVRVQLIKKEEEEMVTPIDTQMCDDLILKMKLIIKK